jgi:hypothetical protein
MKHETAAPLLGGSVALFLLLVSSSPSPAHAANCGTVNRFYAVGQNDETYSKYGESATQSISNQSICGTTLAEGSGAAFFLFIAWPTGDFIATGYYMGWSGDGLVWSGTAEDYYWDRHLLCSTACSYTFSDISQGLGTYPLAGDSIFFQLQGSLNDGTHNWYITIMKSGSYTININNLSGAGDYGGISSAQLESHNNGNALFASFSSLQNLEQIGPSFAWTAWARSYGARMPNDASNPYCYTENSVSSYTMYTSTC